MFNVNHLVIKAIQFVGDVNIYEGIDFPSVWYIYINSKSLEKFGTCIERKLKFNAI